MVNNAGVASIQPIAEVTLEEVEKAFAVNVHGVLWGIQAAAAKFKERGNEGKIISASSIGGHEGSPLLGVYSATRFAVRALTQAGLSIVEVGCRVPRIEDIHICARSSL